MNINEEKGKYISDHIGLENGVIVNSGTIALLSALKILDIKPGDYVLINGYCCYSLFEAIETVGAIPLIYVPNSFYNIDNNELMNIVENYNVKCFIGTHQYGIVQELKGIREKYPNIKIIEDIAQAWNIEYGNEQIGKFSDIVVSSLGKTKPLSYGQAGIVMSNNDLHNYFDFHDRESRMSSNILLPFALYECSNINEKEIVTNADIIVEHQREVASLLFDYFINKKEVKVYKEKLNDNSCYQRFPVVIEDLDYVNQLEKDLNDNNVLYQWQNDLEVWELDMVKNSNAVILNNTQKPKYMLIRTRQNDIDNVKKLVR